MCRWISGHTLVWEWYLIGVMFSSGYSDTISINMSGLTYKRWEDELNKENVLLWINKTFAK